MLPSMVGTYRFGPGSKPVPLPKKCSLLLRQRILRMLVRVHVGCLFALTAMLAGAHMMHLDQT